MREKTKVPIVAPKQGHIGRVVRALVESGWMPVAAPAGGRLHRNQQLLVLQTPHRRFRLRLLVYKVTRSSRGREHERRVEITSTYGHGGIEPLDQFDDVVIGYDPDHDVFVGLDPRRLFHGGKTSNASSFLEVVGLNRTETEPFIVLTRRTRIFPQGEHQAFLKPEWLGDYLQNIQAVHAGGYHHLTRRMATHERGITALGSVANTRAIGDVLTLKRTVDPQRAGIRLTAKALRLADLPVDVIARKVTPEEFRAILQIQEENGRLGEQIVFSQEQKRLSEAGRDDLAERVRWTSRKSIGEGYDIESFEAPSGKPRYIEVKSSAHSGRTFVTSLNEWRTAIRLRGAYCIYYVTSVRSSPQIQILRNPVALEKQGTITIEASGWLVRIRD